ncbi:probable inactive receptor kinase At4g23740 [Syzygium oleosum]|uniref:probable inactive receptor kinase At4g23740 n=1 Tax=Syzygium oleosum TaxID=219896 RepID=UPI0011D1C79F|nr:probable inactive receptor kinase At4g23740 [Syzygium oleosum]
MQALGILASIFYLGLATLRANADPVDDKQALLDFVNNLPHSRFLNWTGDSPVCNHWVGVTCSGDSSRIVGVRLPGVGFEGPIPPNTLGRLSALQILSLRSNGISGNFPPDFANLKNLSFLYLQFNNFSGPLPEDFSVWKNLTIVNLSHNGFNGSIPSSISNLTQLEGLNLASNLLSGEIPDFQLPNLKFLNLSRNNLSGSVPKSLEHFPSSAFDGNSVSLQNSTSELPPAVSPSSEPRTRNGGKLSEGALLGIVIAGCVLVILAFGVVMLFHCSKGRRRATEDRSSGKLPKAEMSPDKEVSRNQEANNKLVFFEGCSYAFDLEDLLRASAEVLGKGTFGTAYKATLEDATTVVVKRLKEVAVGKRDFEQHMEIVGRIRHENVVDLKAYYYSKEEKLIVHDYYHQGSVSAKLHGKRGEGRNPLDWDTRMRIAIGAARGLSHIHLQNNGKLVHGNIKSSNIFLNAERYGCISDLGLATVMSGLATPVSRATGYRAPEVTDTRKATQPADVYSFGVVLLELLTGKSPIHGTTGGGGGGDEIMHLVRWVHSVVREEWTAEVFDIELMRYPNIEEEMVEMLQIAMSCVARLPDQRPKMPDLVKLIEDVRSSSHAPENKSGTLSPPQPAVGTESSSSL